ncbi:hypothetical protein K438DRAFT_1766657 [Mycena galopus ATCC 62051]|nr:hypothetical protein K438DRAFT_1766657 [Mycena galopus ATCC 62051]
MDASFPSILNQLLPNPTNTTFTATLYTSSSSTARYADDADAALRELCVWKADVGVLAAFQEAAQRNPRGGFYTDFELGLEIDSAEVRGVLLDGEGLGREWGRVVFAFL